MTAANHISGLAQVSLLVRDIGRSVAFYRDVHAALGRRGVAFIDAPRRIHTHEDRTEEWMTFFEDPDGDRLALMATLATTAGQSSSER